MDLATFNAADHDDVVAALTTCAAVPWWVRALTAGRPYADDVTLLGRADTLARDWTPDDVRGALAEHPRIGERADGDDRDAELSRGEQSGVGDDRGVRDRLRDGNHAYEQKFGRVFLVRAAGRTGPEMLAELERRLGNDAATESTETATALREIALLRLRALVPATDDEPQGART